MIYCSIPSYTMLYHIMSYHVQPRRRAGGQSCRAPSLAPTTGGFASPSPCPRASVAVAVAVALSLSLSVSLSRSLSLSFFLSLPLSLPLRALARGVDKPPHEAATGLIHASLRVWARRGIADSVVSAGIDAFRSTVVVLASCELGAVALR